MYIFFAVSYNACVNSMVFYSIYSLICPFTAPESTVVTSGYVCPIAFAQYITFCVELWQIMQHLPCLISVLVPRVCDACKETDENDNEIVDNLCKNDFGESTHLFYWSSSSQGEAQGPQKVMKGGTRKFLGNMRRNVTVKCASFTRK